VITDVAVEVEKLLSERSIHPVLVEAKRYPGELLVVVHVNKQEIGSAIALGDVCDNWLAANGIQGSVSFRVADSPSLAHGATAMASLSDARIEQFVSLLQSRARTSETQPSLEYVRNAMYNVSLAQSSRHHLVFGRRGAGKTALLLEAKARLEEQGEIVVWANLQTSSSLAATEIFKTLAKQVADAVGVKVKESSPAKLALKLNEELKRFYYSTGKKAFLMLDDFHHLGIEKQPILLDSLHATFRDTQTWLKVASIKHLSRWYLAESQKGLQLGQDASAIELDLTLQDPTRAKELLEKLLLTYAKQSGLGSISSVFSSTSLDRLMFASGAVPRDYLLLAAETLTKAQERASARQAGVQDVNLAAGAAADRKLHELKQDATGTNLSARAIQRLKSVSAFCLDVERCTYFRIDFRERDKHSTEYNLIQILVDFRLLHLINSSVSDSSEAGEKSEAYTLDLSQYSAERLKKNITALDFEGGRLVRRAAKGKSKTAETNRELVAILRQGPLLDLKSTTVSTSTVRVPKRRRPSNSN
jgi:AAA ATPase domain